MKKFHYVYKITNLKNNKIYIGIHSTKDMNDGYMGSGTIIRRALEKYGEASFKKEILKLFNTRKEALRYEASILTEDFVNNPNVYNIAIGNDSITCITCKNKKWVTKNNEDLFINSYEVESFLKEGWILGRSLKPNMNKDICANRGKILINKNNTLKYINKDEWEIYKKENWNLGSIIKTNNNKKRKWLNNGKINKFVLLSELPNYINTEWKEGKIQKKNPSGKSKITKEEIERRNKILDQYAFKVPNWKQLVKEKWNSKTKIRAWSKKYYIDFFNKYF